MSNPESPVGDIPGERPADFDETVDEIMVRSGHRLTRLQAEARADAIEAYLERVKQGLAELDESNGDQVA